MTPTVEGKPAAAKLLQKQDSPIIQILLLTAINDPITYVLFTAYKFIRVAACFPRTLLKILVVLS